MWIPISKHEAITEIPYSKQNDSQFNDLLYR